jgi:outer membrane protein OmpA-like peptidoglycan-associated protein
MNAARFTRSSARHSLIAIAAAAALLSACSTPATRPDGSETLRARLDQLQSDPDLGGRAPLAMKEADQAVTAAEQPQEDRAQGQYLVFIADRKISIAEATARDHYLVAQRQALADQRNAMQLSERTREANDANMRAADARADARDQRDAANDANVRSAMAQADAGNQRMIADAARRSDAVAQDNAQQLQMQVDELNARMTDRGMVVTLGDLIFATGTADLNSGGNVHLEKLAAFLEKYPNRTARIEGYTDNVGGIDYNIGLSERRADAVRAYLVSQGVNPDNLTTYGKGMSDPIGDNSSAIGRQQNRRVEVVIANSQVSSN